MRLLSATGLRLRLGRLKSETGEHEAKRKRNTLFAVTPRLEAAAKQKASGLQKFRHVFLASVT